MLFENMKTNLTPDIKCFNDPKAKSANIRKSLQKKNLFYFLKEREVLPNPKIPMQKILGHAN